MMDPSTARTLVDALHAAGGIVAAVGAGGKKSTLYRLLEAHRVLGTRRLLLTATVQIAAAPRAHDVETMTIDGVDTAAAIAETEGRDGAWLIAGPSSKPDRFSGLSEDLIPKMHAQGGFGVSLVKADGARMRMIKGPRSDEPALPDGVSTVLPIVSARVFGRPITEKLAHRPERLIEIIDANMGTDLTPDHVSRLLSSPEGALRRAGEATVVPIINMVDTPERRILAREAAVKALSMTDRFDHIVLAAMTDSLPLVEVVTG